MEHLEQFLFRKVPRSVSEELQVSTEERVGAGGVNRTRDVPVKTRYLN